MVVENGIVFFEYSVISYLGKNWGFVKKRRGVYWGGYVIIMEI